MKDIYVQATPATSYLKRKIAAGGIWRNTKRHARRIAIEVLNLFINHDWLFWVVGLVGRSGIVKIQSVFLVYPASEKYALAYVYPSRLIKAHWEPWPAGILRQNGKLGIMFAISATNDEFLDDKNSDNLRYLARRMERLRQLFGATRKSFAGILPGVLSRKGIIAEAPEAELTASAVAQAI